MSEPTLQDLEQIARANGYWHRIAPFHEQVTAIGEVMDAKIRELTQRAEAAEAECDGLKFAQQHIVAERDALRKDAARLDYLDTVRDPYSRRPMREVIGTEWSIVFTHPATHTPTIRAAIDAAMAVQPTTGDKHE